jgi:hypothetical protein
LKDFTTAPPAKNVNNKECDVSQGEKYLAQSSAKVSDYAACKKSCNDAAACQSITFYNSGWCSHFSTRCEKTKPSRNANAERLKDFRTTPAANNAKREECDVSQGEIFLPPSSSQVADYAACEKSCNDAAMCQSITFYAHGWCSHFSTKCEKRKPINNGVAKNLKDNFFNNAECDASKGEVYLGQSSGKQAGLAACKKSCEDASKCKSVTFFRSGWCSHYSTCCKNRKVTEQADALQMRDCKYAFIPANCCMGRVGLGGDSYAFF